MLQCFSLKKNHNLCVCGVLVTINWFSIVLLKCKMMQSVDIFRVFSCINYWKKVDVEFDEGIDRVEYMFGILCIYFLWYGNYSLHVWQSNEMISFLLLNVIGYLRCKKLSFGLMVLGPS